MRTPSSDHIRTETRGVAGVATREVGAYTGIGTFSESNRTDPPSSLAFIRQACHAERPRPMSTPRVSSDDFLTISPRIRVLPIIHGSGDFAIQVREELLSRPYDCVAVPLPPSFQDEVEAAVDRLPAVSVVVQVDAEPTMSGDRGRARLQLCADRPLSGGDRRLADGAGERIARGSSTWKRHGSSR